MKCFLVCAIAFCYFPAFESGRLNPQYLQLEWFVCGHPHCLAQPYACSASTIRASWWIRSSESPYGSPQDDPLPADTCTHWSSVFVKTHTCRAFNACTHPSNQTHWLRISRLWRSCKQPPSIRIWVGHHVFLLPPVSICKQHHLLKAHTFAPNTPYITILTKPFGNRCGRQWLLFYWKNLPLWKLIKPIRCVSHACALNVIHCAVVWSRYWLEKVHLILELGEVCVCTFHKCRCETWGTVGPRESPMLLCLTDESMAALYVMQFKIWLETPPSNFTDWVWLMRQIMSKRLTAWKANELIWATISGQETARIWHDRIAYMVYHDSCLVSQLSHIWKPCKQLSPSSKSSENFAETLHTEVGIGSMRSIHTQSGFGCSSTADSQVLAVQNGWGIQQEGPADADTQMSNLWCTQNFFTALEYCVVVMHAPIDGHACRTCCFLLAPPRQHPSHPATWHGHMVILWYVASGSWATVIRVESLKMW